MRTRRRPKVCDHDSEKIIHNIVEQRLASGERLATETPFVETLGISPLSVREATKSLEFLGIVESKTGVGLTVGVIDSGESLKISGFTRECSLLSRSSGFDGVEEDVVGRLLFHARSHSLSKCRSSLR